MSYPTTIPSFTTKINKNASGWFIPLETFSVPASPFEIYLDHVPTDTKTVVIGQVAGPDWALTTDYSIDYIYGKITFSPAKTGLSARAAYYSLGDDIMAEHMNDVQNNIVLTDTVLGTLPAGAYGTVRQRFEAAEASGVDGNRITDNTVRAGALMSDIKGATWGTTMDVLTDISAHKNKVTSAHNATAIEVTPIGMMTTTNVYQHILQKGSADQTATNPHGVSFLELSAIGSDVDMAAVDLIVGNLEAQWVGISGNMLSINTRGPDRDGFITFYDNGAATTRKITWNNTYNRFELNTDTLFQGDVLASGNVMPTASGYVAGPNANQHSCVGTIAVPFASGNFDKLQASSYKTGASTGATGQFTAGTTVVTVQNGLVVSIV